MKLLTQTMMALLFVFALFGNPVTQGQDDKLGSQLVDLPRTDTHDYLLYFAFPERTGYVVVTEYETYGPYDSEAEAIERAERLPWSHLYWIDTELFPQTWIFWGRYDHRMDAELEASWLRSLGFDTDIQRILELPRK